MKAIVRFVMVGEIAKVVLGGVLPIIVGSAPIYLRVRDACYRRKEKATERRAAGGNTESPVQRRRFASR